jgi:hypothetical protein
VPQYKHFKLGVATVHRPSRVSYKATEHMLGLRDSVDHCHERAARDDLLCELAGRLLEAAWDIDPSRRW